MRAVLLMLCLMGTTVNAQAPLARKMLPPLDASPPSGLDKDLEVALAEVQRALDERRSPAAIDTLVTLFSGNNRFLRAQRGPLAERAVPLLRRAAKMEADAGRVESAAQGYDAAWTLSPRRADTEYSEVLVRWAEQSRSDYPAQALWLARRALRVDGGNLRAAQLNELWSRNQYVAPGVVSLSLGVVAIGCGVVLGLLAGSSNETLRSEVRSRAEADALLETERNYRSGATATLIAGPLFLSGGLFTLVGGIPKTQPESPPHLPALEEGTPLRATLGP